MRRKIHVFLLFLPLFMIFFVGCGKSEDEIIKEKNLDYTVMEEADLPEKLLEIIKQKQAKPFCLTYKDEDALYICRGYGTQNTSGYSITVDELFLGSNAIYLKTTLLGPDQDELVTQTPTHPYIALKIERMDENVVFR